MAKISASSQDYLETILELSEKNQSIRSIDIANLLGVSRASVNKALGVLKSSGLIVQEKYAPIYLTEKGRQEAANVKRRHNVLKRFLTEVLMVNPQTAEVDACKMEHSISWETLNKLEEFFIKNS